MPQVSVMMPAYNAESFLAESVESILNQTFTDFELLILNDGSTDGTLALAQTFAKKDPRVRVLNNGKNRGLAYTRNRLLREAQGEFLAILDSDDISLPERLAKQVAYLEAHPEVGILGGGVIYFSAQNPHKSTSIRLGGSARIAAHLLFQNVMGQSTITLRSSLKHLKYDSTYLSGEDYHLWVRASFETQLDNLQEPLIRYREHEGNISKQKKDVILANNLRIQQMQLERLGLSPSPRNLEVHRYLSAFQLPQSPELFMEALDWLEAIWQANLKTKKYNTEGLREEMYFRLLLLVPRVLDLGRPVAKLLRTHPFTQRILSFSEREKYVFLALSKDKKPPFLHGLWRKLRQA